MSSIYNINIDQGSTYRLSVTYQDPDGNPISNFGYSANLQVRTSYTATSANINLTSAPPYGLQMGGANGVIDITFQPIDTQLLEYVKRAYVYDLELTSGSGEVTRLIEGTFLLFPEATR
jgi:hypothetical protein